MMLLDGYDITAKVFYGTDGKEYTRSDLTMMGIYNPVDYMVPIGKARKERNGSPKNTYTPH